MTLTRYFLRIKVAIILLFAFFCSTPAFSQKWNKAYQDYIDLYKDIAIEQMLKHNIPASITLAQGLLESGAGRSTLAVKGNNHFGIKCHEWNGPTMIKSDDRPDDCFRVYTNPKQSYEDHSAFLKRPRYKSLFQLSRTDYRGWARGLKACGYATNPAYAQSLINIIETYQLYIYDNAKHYDRFMANHAGTSNSLRIEGTSPHHIFSYNKNYYIRARKGDTFRSLSQEMGVSRRNLAKYNELDKNYTLKEGDIIYLKKKRTKATKEYKHRLHTVRNGESLYSIAQLYGIRLSSLYKKNHQPDDYSIRVGDQLRVY